MDDGHCRAARLILAIVSGLALLAPFAAHSEDARCPSFTPDQPQPVSRRDNPVTTGPQPLLVAIASETSRAATLQGQALDRLGSRGVIVSQTDKPSCWMTTKQCYVDVGGGLAEKTLPELSRQLGLQAVFRSKPLRDFSTPPIQGCYSVASAFSLMLSATPMSFEIADDVLTVTPGQIDPSTIEYNLPATDAPTILTEWSRQAHVQLLFDFNVVAPVHIGGPLYGFFHRDQALQTLLAGTTLDYSWVNDHTLAIKARPLVKRAHDPWSPLRQLWRHLTARPHPPENHGLDEVVVASNVLKDAKLSVGAPLATISRADIDRTGLTTAPDVAKTLPQVFGGGPTDHTQLGREAQTDDTFGTGFNLRGLDAGATLVLVDGQRPAPSGTKAEWVDISNFPLSAIDHIDIVADGSSTQYGADAVAGVVNFVTRKNFEGLEVEGDVGRASGGVMGQTLLTGILGTHWDSGRAMVAFEFAQQNTLPAAARAQATNDLVPFGGDNFDEPYGNPGTIVIGAQTWAIPNLHGQPLTVSALQAGTVNLYDQLKGSDVLPSQRRFSLVANLSQSVGEHADLWVDSWISVRHVTDISIGEPDVLSVPATNPYYINPVGGNGPVEVLYGFGSTLGSLENRIGVDSGGTTLGTRFDVGGWKLGAAADYAFERDSLLVGNAVNSATLDTALSSSNPATAFNPFGSNSDAILRQIRGTYSFHSSSAVETLNLTADHSLIEGPAGAVTLATGLQYRQETFDTDTGSESGFSGYLADYSRHVTAGFMELRAPVIGDNNSLDWAHRPEVSLGVRYEDYQKFGGALAPKLGILWSPVPQMSARGTWGRSFRPPALPDLDETHNQSAITSLPDPTSATQKTVLYWLGGDSELRLERSTTSTLGFDFKPIPDLSLGLTYFNIVDRGRIDQLLLSEDSLTDPAFLGSITWNPTPGQRQQVCEHSTFYGPATQCLSIPISAIVDLRAQNLDTLKTSGIDMSGGYRLASAFGNFDLGVDATYLFGFSQARGAETAPFELLNTAREPIDWRARGKVSWKRGPVTTTVFVNFTDSYRDKASTPSRTVASWTTADLNLEYAPGPEGPSWLQGTTFGISAQNVFETQAPFENNGAAAIGYDQENASLVGRVLGFRVRHKW